MLETEDEILALVNHLRGCGIEHFSLFDSNLEPKSLNSRLSRYGIEVIHDISDLLTTHSVPLRNFEDWIARHRILLEEKSVTFYLCEAGSLTTRDEIVEALDSLGKEIVARAINVTNYDLGTWVTINLRAPFCLLVPGNSFIGKTNLSIALNQLGLLRIGGDSILERIALKDILSSTSLHNSCRKGYLAQDWSVSIREVASDIELTKEFVRTVVSLVESKDFIFEMWCPPSLYEVLAKTIQETGYRVWRVDEAGSMSANI